MRPTQQLHDLGQSLWLRQHHSWTPSERDTPTNSRLPGSPQAERPNLFVKIPGTPEGVPAIEESIFAGVPVNVTLLFSREQYLTAAEAYLRGIERRIQAGLNPDVCSLASVFIGRWDKATMEKVPRELRDKLGTAVARRTYKAYRQPLDSDRWLRLANAGPPATALG
jgi:transaldolase